MALGRPHRSMQSPGRLAGPALALVLLLPGCAPLRSALEPPAADPVESDVQLYSTACREHSAYLERELARLQADLRQAEGAMVAIESGLRGVHTRADAVSSIASARVSVQRAAQRAPWRSSELQEARAKIDEAERQLQADRAGSAVFFAARASRIAETLLEEADQVEASPGVRFVTVPSANLRVGPSTEDPVIDVLERETPVFPEREDGSWVLVRTVAGPVGWIHASLLRR